MGVKYIVTWVDYGIKTRTFSTEIESIAFVSEKNIEGYDASIYIKEDNKSPKLWKSFKAVKLYKSPNKSRGLGLFR